MFSVLVNMGTKSLLYITFNVRDTSRKMIITRQVAVTCPRRANGLINGGQGLFDGEDCQVVDTEDTFDKQVNTVPIDNVFGCTQRAGRLRVFALDRPGLRSRKQDTTFAEGPLLLSAGDNPVGMFWDDKELKVVRSDGNVNTFTEDEMEVAQKSSGRLSSTPSVVSCGYCGDYSSC